MHENSNHPNFYLSSSQNPHILTPLNTPPPSFQKKNTTLPHHHHRHRHIKTQTNSQIHPIFSVHGTALPGSTAVCPPLNLSGQYISQTPTTTTKMSLRSRPTTTKQTSIPPNPPESPTPHQPPSSLSQRALTQTLTGTANLANLLPTGTLLALQLLTPTFTSGGACDSATRPMTAALLCLLALSCFLASFTDSFRSPTDGQVYYGFATFNGLWLFDSRAAPGPDSDLKKYRVTLIDWVHGAASMLVFAAVAMRDKSVLSCFYPTPSREVQEVLNAAPLAVGMISSFLFMVFPTRRHGIGYPVTSAT